jgi:RNA polymerase-binding transcription factor DksA
MTGEQGTGARGPRWRALLEARWQARLRELTELSLAYHVALAAAPGHAEARALLRRAVTARRKLADVEEALSRLAAGAFGRCEQCGAQIPDGLLATAPEIRYCARCAGVPSAIRPLTGRTTR